MNTMKGITVYLVRHGQTWFNHFNKMQGWCDSPLTIMGLKMVLKRVSFYATWPSHTLIAATPCELLARPI